MPKSIVFLGWWVQPTVIVNPASTTVTSRTSVDLADNSRFVDGYPVTSGLIRMTVTASAGYILSFDGNLGQINLSGNSPYLEQVIAHATFWI